MDARTFTKMFNTYSDPIYKFLYFRVSNAELAEDLTSVVFTKAWEARDSYTGPNEQAWVFAIARNTLIDSYRKKKELPLDDTVEVESDEDIAAATDNKLLVERLQVAMSHLPDDLSDIVQLRYIERVSVRDAAERLGISEANIRVKQHRALKKLRILYERAK